MIDTQMIELIGRNHLINALLAADFEVAEPMRDRGIDLITYLNIDEDIQQFLAIPIQLKVASNRSFTINKKYNKFPNLIMAYVWHVANDDEEVEIYAVTQSEAVSIADAMGYTQTKSWMKKGIYHVTRVPDNSKLWQQIAPYRMSPDKWREKLLEISGLQP